MNGPFVNLWDVAGVLMIALFLSFIFFVIGVLPFRFVAVVGLLFVGAMIFAAGGSE